MAGTAPSSSREQDAPPRPGGKLIFLFSDGTGNSSAKLQKTNVWRLYEALDLGTAPDCGGQTPTVQIAYYDNGVGTSSVPLLAALAGVFGFGLPRNVRALYTYLCRNYRDGDKIFAFGFSRGAFTIRLLAALVAKMGVVQCRDETDLELQVHDAWREFRSSYRPYYLHWPTRLIRRVWRICVGLKRRAFWQKPVGRLLAETDKTRPRPDIEFVGVWDTVAAYGGPIVEITRAIDMMVWPLSMPDFRLDPKVLRARHALAIDDKRDSFIPLPWDEKHERRLVTEGRVMPDRLRQVFFSGMHADVGGGYADDSLGYVSLVWMIDQLPPGVRFQSQAEQRIRSMANSLGPIHDSRQGIGMLYRYQVRPISAWLHPRRPASWPLLDPATARGPEDPESQSPEEQRNFVFGKNAESLLTPPIRVHCSVTERMDRATDGYAPNNLPVAFNVVGNDDRLIEERNTKQVANSVAWTEQTVSLRRAAYFATLLLIAVLLLMPWWPEIGREGGYFHALLSTESDDRDLAGPVYSLVRGVLPGFLHRWTDLWVHKFWLTLGLFILLMVPILIGISAERRMADHFGSIYRGRASDYGEASRIASAFLRSRRINMLKAWWKWYAVPFCVGSLLLLSIAWAGLASVSQFVMFFWGERDRCSASFKPAKRVAGSTALSFAYVPSHGCSLTRVRVVKGRTYAVELNNVRWSDGGIPAGPDGWHHPNAGQKLLGLVGIPFRRVVRAPYMAPVVEIVPSGHGGEMLIRLEKIEQSGDRWTGKFTAPRSGTLLLFLNDAVFPVEIHRTGWKPRLLFLDVRARAANNRFEDGSKEGQGFIWEGSAARQPPRRNAWA